MSHLNWTIERWKSVLWTDESKFEILGSRRRQFVRRTAGERYLDSCLTSTVKYGEGSVMVWQCFIEVGVEERTSSLIKRHLLTNKAAPPGGIHYSTINLKSTKNLSVAFSLSKREFELKVLQRRWKWIYTYICTEFILFLLVPPNHGALGNCLICLRCSTPLPVGRVSRRTVVGQVTRDSGKILLRTLIFHMYKSLVTFDIFGLTDPSFRLKAIDKIPKPRVILPKFQKLSVFSVSKTNFTAVLILSV